MTYLYRFYDQHDNLLYVGITFSMAIRRGQHAYDKEWFDEVVTIRLERFSSRFEALQAEAEAIGTENPRYNRAGLFWQVGGNAHSYVECTRCLKELPGQPIHLDEPDPPVCECGDLQALIEKVARQEALS